MIAVHPRGMVETARANEILADAHPNELVGRDLEHHRWNTPRPDVINSGLATSGLRTPVTRTASGCRLYDMFSRRRRANERIEHAGTFEGGDFNVIEEGVVLIGCGGARTPGGRRPPGSSWFRKEGWETRLAFFDEYYVHIDLMVVPIAPKLTAVCLACTEPGIVDWLKKGHEIIDVPFQDDEPGVQPCPGARPGDRAEDQPDLIQQLKARGFEVAEVDMSEISKTGGILHGAVAEAGRGLAC